MCMSYMYMSIERECVCVCVIHMLHSARSSSRPWASRIMQEFVATSAHGAYNPEAMVNPSGPNPKTSGIAFL